MKYDINKLTLKEKIGQMIGLAFAGTKYSSELAMQIEEIGAGLIIYFKDNCKALDQIYDLNKTINEKSKIPPFIAIDQEGGMVARVTEQIVQSPGAMAITAGSSLDDCYHLAYNMGKELRALGFNFNFAPVGDVNNNPLNPVINVRSYSSDPQVVADYMESAVKGYTDAQMMTSIKHFPGHGDTAVDSHVGLPVIDFDEERLKEIELVPFARAKEHNLPGIMASHVLYSKYDNEFPTTLSKKVITNLLREEIGFDGLVVTDSLTMKAVWGRFSIEEIVLHGFNSGCDIFLLCGARDIDSQKEFADTALRLAEEGKISIEQINASVSRILKYKEQFEVGNMPKTFEDVKQVVGNKEAIHFAQEVANRSITCIKDETNLLPIKEEDKTLIVFPYLKVVTLVDNADNSLNSLAEYIPFHVDKMYLSSDPSIDEAEKLLAFSKHYDKIIYCSYNAIFNPSQAKLINQIDKDKLVVLAIRTPYDLNVLDVKAYYASYEASVQSFIALANVLTGKVKATGKLPVKLK